MNISNSSKKNTINPRSIIGGVMGWFDETDFEREITSVKENTNGFIDAVISLTEDIVGKKENLPANGSIEFKKQKEETDRKKVFYQAFKEDQDRAEKAKNKLLFEEEINDIVTNLPTEQKNRLLHYQASYKDRSIYQRAELRKKLIEDAKKEEGKKKQAAIPSPAKQANALDTAFEGGSGKSGSGSANFSSTGGGAG